MLLQLWTGWKKVIAIVGAFQSRVLLSLFYFLLLMPYAIAAKCLSDPLRLRRPTGDTNWVPWHSRPADLTEAGRQY
ncbi:MAG: hypothetical protein COZ57_07715 [Armatimonadetes bacterium CG_4_8_14_3_um_filter_66_20]|nr:MAG: hypothetical protein COZ57_07715 [Armatimonadetes bacterium CG_4_8_14_3_um_filter_66_20]